MSWPYKHVWVVYRLEEDPYDDHKAPSLQIESAWPTQMEAEGEVARLGELASERWGGACTTYHYQPAKVYGRHCAELEDENSE